MSVDDGEGEGSLSSRMSNKSEKNMADFDGEDSGCDEELAQLAAHAQAVCQLYIFQFSNDCRLRSIKYELTDS